MNSKTIRNMQRMIIEIIWEKKKVHIIRQINHNARSTECRIYWELFWNSQIIVHHQYNEILYITFTLTKKGHKQLKWNCTSHVIMNYWPVAMLLTHYLPVPANFETVILSSSSTTYSLTVLNTFFYLHLTNTNWQLYIVSRSVSEYVVPLFHQWIMWYVY